MRAPRTLTPPRSSVAETVHLRRERQARLDARARLQWQFWRWRPKMSLCTLQLLALFMGSIVLVSQRSQPWRAGLKLSGHTLPLTAVRFSGNGKRILTAGTDGTTRIYDADTGEQVMILDHKMPVLAADIAPDGTRFAAATDDGWVRVIDTADVDKISFERVFSDVRMLRFSSGSDRLAVTYSNLPVIGAGFVEIHTLARAEPDIEIGALSSGLSSCEFSADGQRVLTASSDGDVHVWDATRTERGFGASLAHMRGDVNIFRSAVFSPDGKVIATAGKDCTVRLWSACFGAETHSIIDPPEKPIPPKEPNAPSVLPVSVPTPERLWMAKSTAVLRGHQQYVLSIQFSPDGERLATVSLDGSVRVWSVRDGAALSVLSAQGPWRSVTFSPDGKRIAAGGVDGSVQLWDRRCNERWYGKLALPEFWLMVGLLPLLIWSFRRDARAMGMQSSLVGIPAPRLDGPNSST